MFKQVGLSVGFLPRPIVTQDRNAHSIEGDFNAELPLYTKSTTLTTYLAQHFPLINRQNETQTFIELFENLWVDMYERGYIEKEDVENIQEWIHVLLHIGYKFPELNNVNYKSPYQRYERSKTADFTSTLASSSLSTSSSSSLSSKRTKSVVSDSFRN